MEIKKVWALYYSATGTTDKTVNTVADELSAKLELPLEQVSFTRPAERMKDYAFTAEDLVVVGSPTYAGRLPNKIAPDFRRALQGNGALAVGIVMFGNRNYDNSLAELGAVLTDGGFRLIGAGAFVGRHAFTDQLGDGRPDWDDRAEMRCFAGEISKKLQRGDLEPPAVPGDPNAPYYVPKGADGEPVKFLQAKPQTDLGKCTECGACARLCPMGAINPANVAEVPGTCIKCQCCVRKCTKHAKYFDDPAFLSHVAMLEQNFTEPKGNEIYL